MHQSSTIRDICENELSQLLDLYRHLHPIGGKNGGGKNGDAASFFITHRRGAESAEARPNINRSCTNPMPI